jgi:hypothetical protein
VVLEILDGKGKLVRRYASNDVPETLNPREMDVPAYWARPPRVLPATTGAHRWVWDCRYPKAIPGVGGLPISAIAHDTPAEPLGPFAAAGRYTVRLTVDGHTYTQPLDLRLDPRIPTPPAKVAAAHNLVMRLYEGVKQASEILEKIGQLRKAKPSAEVDAELAALAGTGGGRRGRRSASNEENLSAVRGALAGLIELIDSSDQAPTSQAVTAAHEKLEQLRMLRGRWDELQKARP